MPDQKLSQLTLISPVLDTAYAEAIQAGANVRFLINAAIRNNRLDQFLAAAAAISMGGFAIQNLATPSNATDAATKGYVDALAAGLDPKQSCFCATTANLSATLDGTSQILTATANGVLSIDGQSPAVGKRILLKNQTTGTQNGVYAVTNAGSGGTPWVLTRTTDGASGSVLTSGSYLFVEQGTANATTGWVLSTADPITIGTTSLGFVQFNGGQSYTAGTGLSLAGNAFSVQFGTAAGTAAQGNDTRITGAAPLNNPTFTGNAGVLAPFMQVRTTRDLTTIVASAATGTINYDALTQGRVYYTTNASGNWTLNIRGDGSNTLNSLLAVGESVSLEFWAAQGATPYWNNILQVDGSAQTIKWITKVAPTGGTASGIDVYAYTILKTAANTYTVLGSQTIFG